ncbi:PREDICTED: uncharacterized protein LOC109174397 [Ipomoea nil]|uniref:uncharacterized protein LOC109174397 n=1 Tax=Ipomoea nil TaxID=35883 RepID=UPI000900DE3E|nr:PREDICTED: uncharacterized protein LOC109174397 [Ipomoea nil]
MEEASRVIYLLNLHAYLCQSTSIPASAPPRRRGPNSSRNLKKKKANEPISIQFDECNRPIGPYSKKFVSYIGIMVRSQVDINFKNWRSVKQTIKDSIWEDVKKEFAIEDVSKKSVVLKIASKRWKDFKSRLIREHYNNKHPLYESPAQLYDYLSVEQWEKFVAGRQTEEFKEKSRKAKESQALNVHPHFLGSAGYASKRQEWMISDPLSSQSSCATISSSLMSDDRSFDWIRARTKKAKDGSYYIPNKKTQEVFQKIVEKCEEVSQGTFQPKRHHDILSAAIGKEDYSGSARGVGGYATIQGVFGKPEHHRSTSSGVVSVDVVKEMMAKCRQDARQDAMTEMEERWQPKIEALNQQLHFLMKNMPSTHLIPQGVSDGTPQSVPAPCDIPQTWSSCHSVDPIATIQSAKRCRLAVCSGGIPIEVATGIVHPRTNETMVYHQSLLPNCVKVFVDDVVDGRGKFNIPVPTQLYATVEDIIGNFAQWPIHLVILNEEKKSSPNQNKNMGDQSGELSTTGVRPPIVGDDVLQHLGNNCKYLVSLLTSFRLDKDCIELECDETIFCHRNTRFIFVMVEDIKNLMMMTNWLDVSIIQVFILFLNQLCNQNQVTSIGFACPTQISKDMAKRNGPAVASYFIKLMEQHNNKQFILAPYHQDNHWLLLVICLRSKSVYVLDPWLLIAAPFKLKLL